jgi:hypothetical protein
MKYNIKIKNIFFLSLGVIVFCWPVGKVLAGEDFCIGTKGEEGICQSWCSGTSVKDEKGSIECAEANYFQNTCCVDPSTAPIATPISSTQINGRPCKSSDGTKVGKCVDGSANGVIPECSAETIPSTDCSKDMFVVCCGDSNSNTTYARPSLIKCHGGAGLCYNKATGGCPGGTEIADTNSECGTAYACCDVAVGASCGTGGSCVDEGVICTNTISGANCGAGKKCCSEKIPQSTTNSNDDPVTVKASSPVTYKSQCNSENKECSHDNDRTILTNQCQNLFSSAECTSMPIYLNSLTDKCLKTKPAGIDCALINSGGYYGNEASKFANYYIQNSNNNPSGTPTGAGGLDFDSIAAMGLPDSPGVKSVLANIVKWMFEILFLITLIAFIISGGQYLLASGSDEMIKTAKKNMTYSVIGIIVALSGFIIVRAIDTALRGTSALF